MDSFDLVVLFIYSIDTGDIGGYCSEYLHSEIEINHHMSIPNIRQAGQTTVDTALLRVAKGSILLLVGGIAAKFFGFLRQFLIIRMLSPNDYGLFALSLTIVTVLAAIGSLGLYHGAQRFIAHNVEIDDFPKVKGTIRSSIWITTATSLLFMILLMAFASTLAGFFAKPGLKSLLLIMSPMVPFQVLASLMMTFFLGLHRPAPSVVIHDIGFGFIGVTAIFISLLIVRSVYAPAIAISSSVFLCFLVSIYFFKLRFPLDLSAVRAFPMTKTLLYFSLPLFLFSILYAIMGNTDTVVIGHFMSASHVGFYNAAYLLMTAIPIFYMAVGVIYLPVATSLKASGSHAESLKLYQSSTRWPFIFTLPLFLTFFLFPAQTLSLLFGVRYTQAATALWVLSIGAFIGTFLGQNATALIAYGDTRQVLYASIAAAAIDIILCVSLVPRIGISGAAIANASALAISNLMYSFVLWIRYKLHPFETKYMATVLFLMAMGIALYKPLRAAINRVDWLVLAIYPLFLIAGLLFVVLTRSVTEEDRLLWKTIKERLRR